MEILHIDFYSGSKRDEIPRRIYTSSGTIIINKIIEIRLEEDFHSREKKKVFIFKSEENKFYQLNERQTSFELKQIELREE